MNNLATKVAMLAVLGTPCWANGDDEKLAPVVKTTLTEIRQAPESFKGVHVELVLQFASIGRIQNPFFTRFIASDFTNFHAWADEQPIWQRENYDDVFGLLFISKDNAELQDVFQLRTYDRLQVRAVVRNTFQGQPWIEVMSLASLDGKVDSATLSHMYRGEEHMKRRQWSRAISELSLAPLGEAPNHVRANVHKSIGVCYLRMGEAAPAADHLAQANTLQQGADDEVQRLLQTAVVSPELGLDRAVDAQKVPDYARPMWEAFEDASAAPPTAR